MKHDVENASCYAILADEAKDTSRKELLGASLEYIYKGYWHYSVEEHGCGHYSWKTDKATSAFWARSLKCVGQGYDGASVMSGRHGCVQGRWKEQVIAMQHTLIVLHRGLVLAAAAEGYPLIKSFFDILDLTYSFMNGTKRHAASLDVQYEHYPNA